MKKFSDTRLWDILRTPAFAYTGKYDFSAVLDEFVSELHIYCRHETKIAEWFATASNPVSNVKLIAHEAFAKS